MAVVKCLPVHTASHLHTLIDYVQQKNKTAEKELIFCSGCQLETAYNDFSMVKKLTGKKGGILAHQIIQSFAIGETTPEEAHQISCQLAEENLQGFQYTVCTHVDKDHIHSHIVLNSVNQKTGKKYHSNLKSLSVLRCESNRLCRERGLSVIENSSGLQGLDKTTYELAKQGNSWKVRLSNDIDTALLNSKDIAQFNKYLSKKGYDVKWTNKNITVQVGEKYRIRLDTLAKQFGTQYCKANIEKHFGIEPTKNVPERITRTVDLTEDDSFFNPVDEIVKPDLETIEKLKDDIKYAEKQAEKILDVPQLVKKIITRMKISAAFLSGNVFKRKLKQQKKKQEERYTKVETKQEEFIYMKLGNTSKYNLINSFGETSSLYIKATDIPKLQMLGIKYSGSASERGVVVHYKAVHNNLVASALGIPLIDIKSVTEKEETKRANALIREMSKAENRELYRVVLTAEQVNELRKNNIPYAFYRNGANYNTVVFRDELSKVCEIANIDYKSELEKIAKRDNHIIYSELKRTAAINNTFVKYRVIDRAGLQKLQQSNIKFAYFEKDGKYNVALLPKDLEQYEKVLSVRQEQEQGKKHRR